MDQKKIAKKLIELRGDIPQEVVANSIGISRSALAMYEAGGRMPRDEIKVKLARYYGLSVETLFFT